MTQNQQSDRAQDAQTGRLSATVRTIIALVLLALGILGILLALDIIPLAEFGRAAVKVFLIGVVVGLTSIGLGLLLR